MNKIALILLAAMLPLMMSAVEPLRFDTVIQVPNIGKQQIYKSAKQWFVNNMNDSQKVIELDNENDAVIMGKFNIPVTCKGFISHCLSGYLKVTFKLQARDGRFKLQVYDANHVGQEQISPDWSMGYVYTSVPEDMGKMKAKYYKDMLKSAIPAFLYSSEFMAISLEKDIKMGKLEDENEDW